MAELKCHLSAVLGAKRINQAECARTTGLSPTTVNALYNETFERVDKQTIIKLCRGLGVKVGDLFEYIPDAE